MQIMLPPPSSHRRLAEAGCLWLVLAVALVELASDQLARLTPTTTTSSSSSSASSSLQTASRSQQTSSGRWLFAPVAAADSYGDSVAGSSPSIEAALEDDDDDDADAELDSAASQEYPEGDGDADDESYSDGDADGDGADEDPDNDRQDSRVHEIWTRPARNLLTRRRRAAGGGGGGGGSLAPVTASLDNNKDEDFAIDDGDEDAWVHDGIDDIHIDPETKRAASELSRDTEHASIDSEYDPHGHQHQHQGQSSAEQPTIMNRTRITTIAEVIPLIRSKSDDDGDNTNGNHHHHNDDDDFAESRQRAPSTPMFAQAMTLRTRPSGGAVYLPAAYLSLDQVRRLIDEQQNQRLVGSRRRQQDDDQADFEGSMQLQRPLLRRLPAQEQHQNQPDQ